MSEKEVRKALAKLQKAANKFNQAIADFQWQYNPESVGLDEWVDHNDEVMSDIEADIASQFEEE